MTKDDLNIKDHSYIESRLRYFKRRGETQKARNLMYKHLIACKIDPTICVDGKYLPLIKEHGEDSLTPSYSLPRVMSAPFQLTLCWNQIIAHEVFSNFIQHAYSTLRSFGQKTGKSDDYILYLEYLRECLVGLKTFDVSAANKVRAVNGGGYWLLNGQWISINGRGKAQESSFQSISLWYAFLLLEKWSGLTAPYSPRYSDAKSESITRRIYIAVSKDQEKRGPLQRAKYGPLHISDEDSAAEMEWQKILLLKYLFGIPISADDLRDDRPISPRPQEEITSWW